ncbi:MAG: hypothetical protein U9O82_00345 [Thermodesulfobacteriota bacterium]|nr:hypothetical protein [Thermodesulfobacteriota bacterium]
MTDRDAKEFWQDFQDDLRKLIREAAAGNFESAREKIIDALGNTFQAVQGPQNTGFCR